MACARLTDDDLLELQTFLCAAPDAGAVMQGTGGIRKIRWALQDRGKRGSSRVIYLDVVTAGKIYLLTVFAKNEKANLSNAERNELKQLSALLKAHAAQNGGTHGK